MSQQMHLPLPRTCPVRKVPFVDGHGHELVHECGRYAANIYPCPDCDDHPGDPSVPAVSASLDQDPPWTEFRHHGHWWRHRLHRDRMEDSGPFTTKAPGEWRWELQKMVHHEWRPVRFYGRRDEVWAMLQEEDGRAS